MDVTDYIDGHAREVTVTGWGCGKCGKFYGDGGHAPVAAAYCCATKRRCECGAETDAKHYIKCDDCRTKAEVEKHAQRERAPWSGGMIYSDAADRYFEDPESALDWLADEDDRDFDDARFLLCKPDNGREFLMSEFLQDSVAEDGEFDFPDTGEIDRAVNEWIAAHAPYSWLPGKVAWNGEVVANGA